MLFLVVIPHFRQKIRRIRRYGENGALERRAGEPTWLPKSLQSSQDGSLTSGWLSLAQDQ